jgi:cystathionine beta-lyase/cystathionine gamma-synthase
VVAGPVDLIAAVERVQVETGASLGPLEAFLVLRGILTLAVRGERHAQNASALASWLERHERVRTVLYPGLPSHPQHAVAARQFRPGVAGGMLAFEVQGGRVAGRAVIDALRIRELTASLGSVHTMVVHPPSTSHRQASEAELLAAGITPGLLRVSVGLEDVEDLQADFAAALAAIPSEILPSRETVPALGAT